MTTMMPAPAGAEPDAVTLQIPAIPMTGEQASIMLDATFDAWRMLSGEIDAVRGDDWQWIQEILALPAHTRYTPGRGRRGHGVLGGDARGLARQMAHTIARPRAERHRRARLI